MNYVKASKYVLSLFDAEQYWLSLPGDRGLYAGKYPPPPPGAGKYQPMSFRGKNVTWGQEKR
jgi:hypothetical protein